MDDLRAAPKATVQRVDPPPIAAALGGEIWAEGAAVDECRRPAADGDHLTARITYEGAFEDGGAHEPEKFDQRYWEPPVLVDILRAAGEPDLTAEREAKHVDFKQRWAAEQDPPVVYLVLSDQEAHDEQAVRDAYERATAAQRPRRRPRRPAGKP